MLKVFLLSIFIITSLTVSAEIVPTRSACIEEYSCYADHNYGGDGVRVVPSRALCYENYPEIFECSSSDNGSNREKEIENNNQSEEKVSYNAVYLSIRDAFKSAKNIKKDHLKLNQYLTCISYYPHENDKIYKDAYNFELGKFGLVYNNKGDFRIKTYVFTPEGLLGNIVVEVEVDPDLRPGGLIRSEHMDGLRVLSDGSLIGEWSHKSSTNISKEEVSLMRENYRVYSYSICE